MQKSSHPWYLYSLLAREASRLTWHAEILCLLSFMATFRAGRLFSLFLLENLTSHMIVTKTSLWGERRMKRLNVLIIEAYTSARSKEKKCLTVVGFPGWDKNLMSSICSGTGVLESVCYAQSNHFCVELSFMAFCGKGCTKVLINK